MDALALGLYLVFAIAAFGWRTLVQWRQTGDTGLRLHAPIGTRQWWAKLGFVAALLAGVAAPVAGLAGLAPIDVLDITALRAAGAIAAVLGIAATLAAQWQMGASWRIGVDPNERTGLVRSGVFGVVRNPIFTAMLVFAIGMALLVANPPGLVGVTALLAALEVQVRLVEEPYLRQTHGSAYEAYGSRTGRFVPAVGRLRSHS